MRSSKIRINIWLETISKIKLNTYDDEHYNTQILTQLLVFLARKDLCICIHSKVLPKGLYTWMTSTGRTSVSYDGIRATQPLSYFA